MRRLLLIGLVALCVGTVHAQELIKESPHQMLYRTQGSFAETRENVELAIQDQGLVINYIAEVGEMLARTGKDLGYATHIYTHGDVIEFCSASLSREMAEADPTNLVFCPYAVHLYELAAEPGSIYVGYKRPQAVGGEASQTALARIETLLAEIVEAALSW